MSVKGASASASEPRYISPSPKPTASGAPWRAPIRRSSSPLKSSAKREGALEARQARGHGLDRLHAVLHRIGDEMRDDFRVGLG